MRRLTPFTLIWRNFLYANQDGNANDPKEFLTRMLLIQNSREEILEQMLKPKPDLFVVGVAKEEIEFQLENLEEMMQEFSRYAKEYHFYETMELLQKEVCEDLQSAGTESELYIIAEEWNEYAANATRVIQEMPESPDFSVRQQDYLIEQMMELQDLGGRENFQQVKRQTEQSRLGNSQMKKNVRGRKHDKR